MLTPTDKWRITSTALPTLYLFFYLGKMLLSFRKYPEDIAVHFDMDGEPDGWMNKYLWLILSPVLCGAVITLTLLAPNTPWSVPSVLNWSVSGLVIGSFLEVSDCATNQHRFRFRPLLFSTTLLPLAELLLCTVLKHW